MDSKKIREELERKYSGKRIIFLPEKNPTEIICETDPPDKHPDYSISVAVIEKSAAHYHKITTEEYEVLSGSVTLFLSDKKLDLKAADKVIIKPGTIHWAEASSAWIKCTARPAWTPQDHILWH